MVLEFGFLLDSLVLTYTRWFKGIQRWEGDSEVSIHGENGLSVYKTISLCTPGHDNDLYSLFFEQRHLWKKKNTFNHYQYGDVWITRYIWPYLYGIPTWRRIWQRGTFQSVITVKFVRVSVRNISSVSILSCSVFWALCLAVAVLGGTERIHMDGPSLHISMQLLRVPPRAYSVNSPPVFYCVRNDDHMIFLRICQLFWLVDTWKG